MRSGKRIIGQQPVPDNKDTPLFRPLLHWQLLAGAAGGALHEVVQVVAAGEHVTHPRYHDGLYWNIQGEPYSLPHLLKVTTADTAGQNSD